LAHFFFSSFSFFFFGVEGTIRINIDIM